MTTTFRVSFALVCAAAATFATLSCSGSSGGSGGGGSPDGGSGGVTMSCSLGDLCTQVIALSSEQAAEQQACAQQGASGGTFAVAACPTAGSLGCCTDPGGTEMQCAYSQSEATVLQSLCNNGKTWSGADGGGGSSSVGDVGASGAAAFVGTWARSGTETVTCPTGNPTTKAITGNLVIALGSASDAVVGTQPDGCQTNYAVSGNVAIAAAGQPCNITTEAGVAETITLTSHTLTLSADGTTLDSEANATIDKTATNTTCTSVSSGTFTKQ